MAKKTIQISDELHHFLTINAVRKTETYDEIIRRLFRSGLKFSIDNTLVLGENEPQKES